MDYFILLFPLWRFNLVQKFHNYLWNAYSVPSTELFYKEHLTSFLQQLYAVGTIIIPIILGGPTYREVKVIQQVAEPEWTAWLLRAPDIRYFLKISIIFDGNLSKRYISASLM